MSWLAFGLLLAVALACLAPPLRRARMAAPGAPEAEQLVVFRAREQELADQFARAEIDPVQHQLLLGEAQRQLLQDNASVVPVRAGSGGGGWLLAVAGMVVIALALAGYYRLGAWPDVALRDALASADSPAPVIDRLRDRLGAAPDNTTYWLLLARLEQQQGDMDAALTAYRQVLDREPDAVVVRAEYAQLLFLAAGNVVTEAARDQAQRVLDAQPDNALALSLQGIDAFQQDRYGDAIDAWQRVLEVAPDSAEAEAVSMAIAAARARLGEAAAPPLLRISVALAPGVAADPATPVFVYVREWQGAPMPVAARRLRVAELPAEIAFAADSGLSPDRPLASIDRFEVVARLSRSGTPTPGPDDLETRAGPFERAAGPRQIELILAP
jgi:cytochrome c-type biogenesis protein CcmH